VKAPAEGGDRYVLVVTVDEGVGKPYKDLNGAIWIKQGSDKRRLTENVEIVRFFQQGWMLFADEMPVFETSVKDIDEKKVREYLGKIRKDEDVEEIMLDKTLYQNLTVLKNNHLTLAGLMFFGKNPQRYRSALCIKAVSYFGNSIGGTEYRDSRDIVGTIPDMFREGMSFFTANLHHVQAGQNFNFTGKLEISTVAIEELLQNALIHRDYTKNAPIRLMIFDNRIEIVSPGRLTNGLTVESIKMGNAAARNNLMISYCSKLMIYRGFGSGIIRALEYQPDLQFFNDEEGEQFVAIIPRDENWVENKNAQVTPQVERLLQVISKEDSGKREIMTVLGIKDYKYFKNDFLRPAIKAGLIDMTQPDSPRSPTQKYRLSALGKKVKNQLGYN